MGAIRSVSFSHPADVEVQTKYISVHISRLARNRRTSASSKPLRPKCLVDRKYSNASPIEITIFFLVLHLGTGSYGAPTDMNPSQGVPEDESPCGVGLFHNSTFDGHRILT